MSTRGRTPVGSTFNIIVGDRRRRERVVIGKIWRASANTWRWELNTRLRGGRRSFGKTTTRNLAKTQAIAAWNAR
jgi:hypothetical protein